LVPVFTAGGLLEAGVNFDFFGHQWKGPEVPPDPFDRIPTQKAKIKLWLGPLADGASSAPAF
jgi:hypothetical protein